MKKVLLNSGGFDSLSLGALEIFAGNELYGLTLDFGLENGEVESAEKTASLLGINNKILTFKTTLDTFLVEHKSPAIPDMKVTAVGGITLLAPVLGMHYAKFIKAQAVVSGITYSGRDKILIIPGITFETPLLDLYKSNKTELGMRALATGLISAKDLFDTVSCNDVPPCGKCGNCTAKERFKGELKMRRGKIRVKNKEIITVEY